MSAEHHIDHERSEQANKELEAARLDRLNELKQTAELSPDNSETNVEAAREAIKNLEKTPEPNQKEAEAAPKEPVKTPFLTTKLNYLDTMASLQTKLAPVSRSFSKFIHTPIVDKASEALEKTVGRPSVTLGATWTALIVGSVFFFTARHYGYQLSGSELIFSFVVGALIGIIIEGLWRVFRHRA
jgi:hypothetical protein